MVEVIAAVKFPIQLQLAETIPVDFQDKVKDLYPLLKIVKQLIRVPNSEGQKDAASASIASSTEYRFSSADEKHQVVLSSELLALTTTSYTKWEVFSAQFYRVLEAVLDLYKIPLITRIGLRYKDVVVKSDLGLADKSWAELIKPELLSPVSVFTSGLDDYPSPNYSTSVTLDLPDEGKVAINYGFVTDRKNKYGFLIDTDCYVESNTVGTAGEVKRTLEGFHDFTSLVFRSSITDALHNALEPVSQN